MLHTRPVGEYTGDVRVAMSRQESAWSLARRMRLALLLLFVPVLLLGSIYYLHLSSELEKELKQDLMDQNRRIRTVYVTPYLDNLQRQFNLLYERLDYRDFLAADPQIIQRYQVDWQFFFSLRSDLKYIYVGTEQRRMFITPAWVPDEQFDPRYRPWYRLAQAHPDQTVWVPPYYDYLNHDLVMGMSRALLDEHKRVRGVFAIDFALNRLSRVMEVPGTHMRSMQMIVNRNGQLVAHPDDARLLKIMEYPNWLPRLLGQEGQFVDQQAQYYVSYLTLPLQDWILISVLPTAELDSIKHTALLNVFYMVALSSLLYLLMALIWSRYFRRMLAELSGVIRSASGDKEAPPRTAMRELSHVYAELNAVGQGYELARQQANLDRLTGLYNRHFFDEQLQALLESRHPFYLGMIDLDHFKLINDTYGHQTGDTVLRRVATTGMALFSQHGWFCRYGGEELVVMLLVDNEQLALAMMEDLRQEVALLHWRESGLQVTLSGGLVRVQGGGLECLQRVDALVYAAKRQGRNQIVHEGDGSTQ